MCRDHGPGPGAPTATPILHDVEPAIEIDLEPVDSVVVTTAFVPNAVGSSFHL